MRKIERYFELMDLYPNLFENNSSLLTIVKDKNVITDYIKEHQIQLGVLYESQYNILVKDLVVNKDNHMFSYERLIRPNGVIVITKFNNKYLLLNQYRHALRKCQLGFVRGYMESNMSGIDNAVKELKEEINPDIESIQYLGYFVPDSGLSNTEVEVYLASISSYKIINGNEEINDMVLLSENEIKEHINSNIICDSMTLSALSLLFNMD